MDMDKQDTKMSEQPSDHQVLPSATPKVTPASKAHRTSHRPSRKQLWLGLLAVLVILTIVGLITHQSSKKPANTTTTPPASIARVQVLSDKFLPGVISVKAGTTITWTNKDTTVHWVASDPYPKDDKLASLNSLALAPKDSFSYTFNSKGTYTYHDNLNPYKLQGTVVVE